MGDAGDGPGRGAVSAGDGIKDRNGVGVGDGVDIGVDVGVAVGIGLGDDVDAGVGVGDRVADRDSAVNGVDVGRGIDVGVAVSVGLGVGDEVGVGEGRSTIGSSVGCASTAGGNCSLGLGADGRVDPGSDQSPALSPLTKVVCNLV